MADPGVRPACGQRVVALRVIQHVPGGRQQIEAQAQQQVAGNVQDAEMRVALLAQQRRPQLARVMGEQIEVGEPGLQPARQQINRQRETVHFHEQGDDERREGTEAAPVPGGRRLEEAEGEHDEDRRVDEHQRPQAIGGFGMIHDRCSGLSSSVFADAAGLPWPCCRCPPCPWCMKTCINGQASSSR
ncbi:hypothetical protein D9M69_528170 [compost metagenome]